MPIAVPMAELSSPAASFDAENETQLEKSEQKRRLRDLFGFSRWRKSEEQTPCPDPKKAQTPPQTPVKSERPGLGLGRRLSRKGLVGIPRSQTFRRQEDEQRKNLQPVETERRSLSKVRQRALSAAPEPPRFKYRDTSVPPDFQHAYQSIDGRIDQTAVRELITTQKDQEQIPPPPPPHPPPQDPDSHPDGDIAMSEGSLDDDALDEELMEELKKKWILNLSMHFRDKSPREKFFLTYAETPDRWRRVTVSCDYRNAPLHSLEFDLQNLNYQKDKSARIYESIRMSLPDIQFYDTVTNLKLETKDDRLHVHVTEDVNEIIPYPPKHLVSHLSHVPRYKEKELHFDEHMSGFVYRVNVGGHTWIKKEIPGPDSVDEFLYEVNALSELIGSKNVIQLKGLVIDNEENLIKGLLLGYAEHGALVDILYDSKEGHIPPVPWARRERWAKQIIQGLSNLHEGGFVQGDFTLSNIVVDENDQAQIIDINRRGCPVGWESPEMVPLVESGQRLSMYIGVKSDLYQLGMVLWALAMEQDEPERAKRPLRLDQADTEIPQYFRHLTGICLSEKPKQRFAAKDLLAMFSAPALFSDLRRQDMSPLSANENPGSPDLDQRDKIRSEDADLIGTISQDRQKRYHPTNGAHLVPLADYEARNSRQGRSQDTDEEGFRGRRYSPVRSGTLGFPQDGSRGMLPPMKQLSFSNRSAEFIPRRDDDNDGADEDEAQVIPISPTGDGGWQEINMDGNPYLIHRDTLESFNDFPPNVPHAHRGKTVEQWRQEVEHVDSGLADMDPDDLGKSESHHPLLAGIGGHEALEIGQQFGGGGGSPPQRITDDLDVEHQDEKNASRSLLEDLRTEYDDGNNTSQRVIEIPESEHKGPEAVSQCETQPLGEEYRAEQQSMEGTTKAPSTEHPTQEKTTAEQQSPEGITGEP